MQTDIGPAIARVTARESREFRVLLSTPALTKGRDEKKKKGNQRTEEVDSKRDN